MPNVWDVALVITDRPQGPQPRPTVAFSHPCGGWGAEFWEFEAEVFGCGDGAAASSAVHFTPLTDLAWSKVLIERNRSLLNL